LKQLINKFGWSVLILEMIESACIVSAALETRLLINSLTML